MDVQVGDFVLTHDNTYQEVLKTFDNGIKPLVKINAMAVDEIKCTTNHRFYVRTMRRVGHLGKRVFDEPIWKQASELTKKDYLGVAINQNSIVHEWNGVDYHWQDGRADRHKNTINGLLHYYDFWWIIGRYIGDGWQTKNGIIICCPKHNTEEIEKRLGKIVNYTKTEDRSTYRYVISSKEWLAFVCQFGKGAEHKHLTDTILDLPRALLKGFLDGYMSADGCYSCNLYKATSISRELVYGLAQCVAKVYRVPYRIYHTKRPPKYIIEGRQVNQHDTWQLVWKTQIGKQDKAFFQDNHVWFPIKEITEIEPQNVYDIEVENNHSFTVQNTIVHNCQDLSQAGKGKGMAKDSGTRSGLLWEVERLLKECVKLPQVLIMENVPQVIGKKNIQHFANWVSFLDSLGYKSKWNILNAKGFKIPQNRERCFMVSILGDYFYNFPRERELEYRLKDFLDRNVDESYYLSEKTVASLNLHRARHQAAGNGFGWQPTNGGGYAHAIKTESGYRPDSNFIIESIHNDIEGNHGEADGILLGKSPSFSRPPLPDLCKTIDTNGANGVVEWKRDTK